MNILFTILTLASSAFAGSPYCQKMSLSHGETLSYCVVSPSLTQPKGILYYMHGLGGSANEINGSVLEEGIQTLFAQTGADAPVIVALDFGASTVITAGGTRDRDLATEAMPKIETEVGLDAGNFKRHLMGASLGGMNALNFAAGHSAMFKSLEALCPAVIAFDPFDNKQADAYIYRGQGHIQPNLVGTMVNQLRQTYRSEAAWTRNNPIARAKAGAYSRLDVFISTGEQDDYGFNEGSKALYSAMAGTHSARRRSYVPVNGGHCSFGTENLLNFLKRELVN